MRRVENLVVLRELVVDEAEEVALRGRVERQSRLVEQEDRPTARLLLDVGEVGEEREEPDEAARPLVEGDCYAVPRVVDPDVHDRPLVQRRLVVRIGVGHADFQPKVLVLGPVLENLVGDPVRGAFELSGQALEIRRLEVLQVGVNRGQQREERLFGLGEDAGGLSLLDVRQ